MGNPDGLWLVMFFLFENFPKKCRNKRFGMVEFVF